MAEKTPEKSADKPAPPALIPTTKLVEAIKALAADQAGKEQPLDNAGLLFALHPSLPPPQAAAAHGVAFAANTGRLSEAGAQYLADATPEQLAELVAELVQFKRADDAAVIAHCLRKWPHKRPAVAPI